VKRACGVDGNCKYIIITGHVAHHFIFPLALCEMSRLLNTPTDDTYLKLLLHPP
jgi:hypothetical protein